MKKSSHSIFLVTLFIVTGLKCLGQGNDRAMLKQVIKENQEAVNAIAMYPTETRKIIFQASEYPEVIAKLNAMQKNTQDAFQNLISSFSKEEQEKIWDLTRYEDLISDIAADHKKSEAELNIIIAKYPEEIHKTALEEGINNYDLLVQIDNMNISYNSDFELLISTYPLEAVNAFREIIKLPDVLQILFDHMQYTVVIGDYYKKNPDRVLHKTDSLNQVLTQKNTQEASDWKQSINDNPQAQQEYTQAAQEYAQDNGYQPEDYNAPVTADVTDYNTNSYDWWFGYPSWYSYSYWTPYPYWYDWGFYYGPGRHIIYYGLPSAYFMNWYFSRPEHFSKYPELSNHYYNYYDRHRSSFNNNSISHSVNSWRKSNRDIVTDDWDKDNTNRAQRFKEYGQLEINRQIYNAKHPHQQMQQTEYLQKKQSKYPTLSADISEKQSMQKEVQSKPIHENTHQSYNKPSVTTPERKKTSVNVQNNINAPKPNEYKQQPVYTSPQIKNASQPKQTQNFNQIRNAQQYHENTWKQIEPQTQPQREQPQRQPERQQPQQQNYSPPKQQENHQNQQQDKHENQSSPTIRRR